MSLEKIFKTTLSGKYTTADKLAAEYPEGVTIIGFGYAEVKGEKLPYFRVAEDGGQNFLAGGKLLNDLVAKLEAEYGTAEAIDAALKEKPQAIKIHPIMSLPNGRKFRLVEFLEGEEYDVQTGEVGT